VTTLTDMLWSIVTGRVSTLPVMVQKLRLVWYGGSGPLASIAVGTWGEPWAASGATCSGIRSRTMGALSPVSAVLFTRLGVQHLVQEARQSSNILKKK
jgi:hypothetical protein